MKTDKKKMLFASAAVLAGLAGLTGSIAIDAQPRAENFSPLLLANGLCGRKTDTGQTRRGYFIAMARAYAKETDAAAPTAAPRLVPTPGISYAVTTQSDKAQNLFNAGLAQLWNFNHDEAIRAFKAAQTEDPNCAMCYWAEAFAHGPNINAPMATEAVAPAYAALAAALKRKGNASDKEADLIDALSKRYRKNPSTDRSRLDAAFADAMDALALKYPDDNFILATAAEANMDTQAWDYWEADGRTPKGRTGRTISLIETILARAPGYQPASHLYIHITEGSTNPYRALPYADKLDDASPGLAHLIHMPSHTYYRVGEFKKSIDANARAVAADEAFLAGGKHSPMYKYGYHTHNVHFLMTSAQMAGDGALALQMADKLDALLPMDMALEIPFAQPIKAAPLFAYAQFADPDATLALKDPGDGAPFIKAAWRYARGEALARKGDAEAAMKEADAIGALIANADLKAASDFGIPAADILTIEQLTLIGRVAALKGDYASAVEAMEKATQIQESLPYYEPPFWYYPAKQTLAAYVLEAGDAKRAEQLFHEALVETPNNGWAYFGLAEAYDRQGDKAGKKFARAMMKNAWTGEKKDLSLDRL